MHSNAGDTTTTLGAMAIAFVPSPDEHHPAIAVLKVAGMTLTLLLAGAAIYLAGNARARRSRWSVLMSFSMTCGCR